MSEASTYRCVNEPEFHYKGYRSVNGYGFEVCITCGHIFSQEKGPELDKALAELSHLQKLCEERDKELARVRQENDSLYAYKTVRGSHLECEVERLEKLCEEQKQLIASGPTVNDDLRCENEHLKAKVEEQNGEIERLKEHELTWRHDFPVGWHGTHSKLKSQIAEQTERARRLEVEISALKANHIPLSILETELAVDKMLYEPMTKTLRSRIVVLREALELIVKFASETSSDLGEVYPDCEYHRIAKQALNQESLGAYLEGGFWGLWKPWPTLQRQLQAH